MEPIIVSKSEFRPDCINLLNQVVNSDITVLITQNNKPIAKLSPVNDSPSKSALGKLKGKISYASADDLFSADEDWNSDEENI